MKKGMEDGVQKTFSEEKEVRADRKMDVQNKKKQTVVFEEK